MPFMRAGRPGLLRTVGRTAVVAGTASMTANAVNRRAAANVQQQQEAAAYEAEQQQQQAPPTGTDLVARLSELAKLRDSGALSESEFEAAKAQLLVT